MGIKPRKVRFTAGIKKESILFTSIALLSFFVALYSLTYSGTFSSDDEHILASRALSLAFDGHFNISRVLGNSRVFELSQLPVVEAKEVANIEPVQAVLGALLARLSILSGVGRIQTMFLLNIWVTALTSVIIFLTAIQKYTKRTSLLVAGLFGLGTIAFPYARTFFRDSLAMLFLACAWMFANRIVLWKGEATKPRSKVLSWLGFIGFSLAAMLSKNTTTIAIPVMLLQIFVNNNLNKNLHISNLFSKKTAYFVISLVLVGLAWFLVVPQIPWLARFSPAYYRSLIEFFLTTPRPNLFHAIIGPLVSPGKSIFVFSPVLLLSLWSLIRHFRESWAAWLYLVLLVFFQALFYDAEWAGHVNWGLRFVLPAIPPLVLTAALAIEDWGRSLKGRLSLAVTALVSFFIQILGILVPVTQYYVEKLNSNPLITEYSPIWQIKHSILAWSVDWIFGGKPLNLVVTRIPGNLWFLLLGLIIVGVILYITNKYPNFYLGAFISLVLVIGLNIEMLFFYRGDPEYFLMRQDLVLSQNFLTENAQNQDLVLLKNYGSPVWKYWMNWSDEKIEWTSLPYSFPSPARVEKFNQTQDPEDALDPITLALFNELIKPGMRVWFLNPGDSPGANLGLEVRWMETNSVKHECQDFIGGVINTQVCWFEIKEYR